MNHKHHFFHATRFRFFATAFEYETIRGRQERKQRRPNSKMHKTSPVKFSPRGQPPLLVAINREVLQKNYKKMGRKKKTYKIRERANVVDFDFATSCHFKWRMPLRVAYATSSGVCHFEWRMPLRVACATSSGVCHFEWRADCVAFAFRVAHAT